MYNKPTYKIHGETRKKLKKELSETKAFLKNFWRSHNEEKFAYEYHGCASEYTQKQDEDAKRVYNREKARAECLEQLLSEPYED